MIDSQHSDGTRHLHLQGSGRARSTTFQRSYDPLKHLAPLTEQQHRTPDDLNPHNIPNATTVLQITSEQDSWNWNQTQKYNNNIKN
jgi:hypothetical protein